MTLPLSLPTAKIDWMTLRLARRVLDADDLMDINTGQIDEQVDRAPTREEIRTWSWNSTNLSVIEGKLIDPRTDEGPCGSLQSMHGGVHVVLPGTYWRTHYDPAGLRGLLAALLDGQLCEWHPSHLTCPRIDYAQEWSWNTDPRLAPLHLGVPGLQDVVLAVLQDLAARVAARLAALYPHRTITHTRTISDTGVTIYTGFAPSDSMRKRELIVRSYSKYTDRTIRCEAECKQLDGNNLREQFAHAAYQAHIALAAQPESFPKLADHLPGRTDTGIVEMIDRTVGCYLSASQRTHHSPTAQQLDALEVACGHVLGFERAKRRIAHALKKRGFDDPRKHEPTE